MRTIRSAALILALAACGLERGVITLGKEDGVPELAVDRYFRELPELSDSAPPDGPVSFKTDGSTTYTAQIATDSSDKSRTLTFSDELVVFSESQSRQASQKLSGLNIEAVQALEIDFTQFALKDATQAGEPLVDLAGLKALSLKLNGKELLTKADVQTLQGGASLSKRLEEADVSPYTQAVKAGSAAKAKLEVAATVQKSALSSFPKSVHLLVRAQPKVEVSVLKAAGIQ